MNRTYLVFLIGIVLVASLVHWYKYKTSSIELSSPNYVLRLIDWAKKYHAVKPEDISHIQDATSIKSFFIFLKKVPTCRSAKLLAHLYFSIYVERDNKALREFVGLMKKYYPDSYQWDNAFYWKHAEQLLWDTYHTLSSNDLNDDKPRSESSKQKEMKVSNKRLSTSSKSTSNNVIKDFKAVISK